MSEVQHTALVMPRPSEVTASFWCWMLGVLLWPGGTLLMTLLDWNQVFDRAATLAREVSVFTVGVRFFVELACATPYLIFALRLRWAERGSRAALLALGVLGLLVSLGALIGSFDGTYGVHGFPEAVRVVLSVTRPALTLLAIGLMFLPRANGYFAAYR